MSQQANLTYQLISKHLFLSVLSLNFFHFWLEKSLTNSKMTFPQAMIKESAIILYFWYISGVACSKREGGGGVTSWTKCESTRKRIRGCERSFWSYFLRYLSLINSTFLLSRHLFFNSSSFSSPVWGRSAVPHRYATVHCNSPRCFCTLDFKVHHILRKWRAPMEIFLIRKVGWFCAVFHIGKLTDKFL